MLPCRHQLLPPPSRLRTHPVNPPDPSPRLLRRCCCCSGASEPDHGDDHEENDCELQPDGDAASRAADGWLRSRSGLSGITTGLPLVPSAAGRFPGGLLALSDLHVVREGLRNEANIEKGTHWGASMLRRQCGHVLCWFSHSSMQL